MWAESSALSAWGEAMTMQTLHELDCQPCRANRTPACPEGRRLQTAARAAHEAWAASVYVPLAVAS